MICFRRKLSLALFVVITLPAQAAFAIRADELLRSLRPTADVNDFAGLLSPAEREQLEARCRQLRERTGAQLAVVTLKSLDGGQIDDFAVKLFKSWGIGQKDQKNGVLLLVAISDRKARIEVGYGLEPIIPDGLAGRIIDRDLVPQFRNQRYAAGLRAAVNSICERIEAGQPADRRAVASEKKSTDVLGLVLLLAFFIVLGGLILGSGIAVPRFGVTAFGAILSGACILLGLATAGILSLAVHLPAAILGTVLGWNMTRRGPQLMQPTQRYRNTSPSPWTWSNFGGYSGGGWSSGGGGFSQGWGGFGGGSSGGGGASGSW